MRSFYTIALCLSLAGCGGGLPSGTGTRVYNLAIRTAHRVCRAIDAIPDPPAEGTGSGGEMQ